MTLENLSPGEVLTVRVYKALVSRPDAVWANTYEFQVESGVTVSNGAAAANTLANALVSFEQKIHLSDVRFDRAVVSTFNEDGQPYNPATFVSVPIAGQNGLRVPGTEPLALQMCLLVRREVALGRVGRALYRRVLQESDVNAPSGTPSISDVALPSLGGLLDTAFFDLTNDIDGTGLSLVMASRVAPVGALVVRPVTALTVAGVSVKKFNNRYFDRA